MNLVDLKPLNLYIPVHEFTDDCLQGIRLKGYSVSVFFLKVSRFGDKPSVYAVSSPYNNKDTWNLSVLIVRFMRNCLTLLGVFVY